MTSKCERMSLKGKWESIASLNQVCTSMSICAFGKYKVVLLLEILYINMEVLLLITVDNIFQIQSKDMMQTSMYGK